MTPLDAKFELYSIMEEPVRQVTTAEGLYKTVFEQDSSSLNVKLTSSPFGSDGSRYHVRLLGIPTPTHPDLVGALWIYQSANGKEFANYPDVLVGTLISGSVFAEDAACVDFGSLIQSRVAFATGTVDILSCALPGGGLSWRYKVVEIRINDTSPAVPEAERGVDIVRKGAEILDPFVFSHHNWCDIFMIDMGHAVYRFSSKGADDCDPQPAIGDVPFGSYLATKYGNAPWQGQALSCNGFLQCGNAP